MEDKQLVGLLIKAHAARIKSEMDKLEDTLSYSVAALGLSDPEEEGYFEKRNGRLVMLSGLKDVLSDLEEVAEVFKRDGYEMQEPEGHP